MAMSEQGFEKLFDETTWVAIERLAESQGIDAAEYVRQAVLAKLSKPPKRLTLSGVSPEEFREFLASQEPSPSLKEAVEQIRSERAS